MVIDLRTSPNKIQEETDDRITIVERYNSVWGKIIGILFGFFFLFFSYLENSFLAKILLLAIGGCISLFGILSLFVSYSVTIDKKSERIIKKGDSNFNLLNSTEEISFSDISRIKIEKHVRRDEDKTYTYTWSVNLIKIQGGFTEIFETPESSISDESDAEIIAKKIRNITNKVVIFFKPLSGRNKLCPVKDCTVVKSTYRGLARHIAVEGNNDSDNLHTQYKESKGLLRYWKTEEELTKATDEIMKIEGWEDKEDLVKQA